MSVPRTNVSRAVGHGETTETWEEHYGQFVVFVERHTTERHRDGRRLSKTVERAKACRIGCGDILYEVDPSDRNLMAQRPSNGKNLAQFARPREEVLAWLFANHPEARAAAKAATDSCKAEGVAQRTACIARVRELGILPFLVEEGGGYVSTPDLAKMMGITPSQLGTFLRAVGLATREGQKWMATNPAFIHRENGTYVSWNSVGAEAVWAAAYAHGVTTEPPEMLLRHLRKRFPYLPEWAVIDEAAAGSDAGRGGD